MVTAAGTLGSIAAAAARVPALTTLATSATARKRRRVVSTGVFGGGVLSTLSAWVIWVRSPFWLGLEPGRKFQLPLGLILRQTYIHEEVNKRYSKKAGRPATGTAPMVGVRMTPEFQRPIKAWAKSQDDRPSMAEAIRRLVELGLKAKEK
jgi:hypothetical protein